MIPLVYCQPRYFAIMRTNTANAWRVSLPGPLQHSHAGCIPAPKSYPIRSHTCRKRTHYTAPATGHPALPKLALIHQTRPRISCDNEGGVGVLGAALQARILSKAGLVQHRTHLADQVPAPPKVNHVREEASACTWLCGRSALYSGECFESVP